MKKQSKELIEFGEGVEDVLSELEFLFDDCISLPRKQKLQVFKQMFLSFYQAMREKKEKVDAVPASRD
jgi:hypothetical protein